MGADLDLDTRELCPDGACIGVIGDDGRCKVCGRRGEGPAAQRSAVLRPDPSSLDDDDGEDGGSDGDALEAGAAPPDPAVFEDDDRELCPDGACIGLIGPDGVCKVCGRSRGS